MSQGRWPWYGAAGLLFGAALVGGAAVRRHWLPCRGEMLNGSILHGYAYGADFSDGCLQAMDSGFAFLHPRDGGGPWPLELLLGMAAGVLLALAWALVVLTEPWPVRTRVVALLPAAATLVTVGACLFGSGESHVFTLLLLAPNISAVVAVVAILATELWSASLRLPSLLVLVGATTSFALLPVIGEYAFMITVSGANWDVPPGSGYPIVAGIAAAAVLLVVTTRHHGQTLRRRARALAGRPLAPAR